MDPTTVDPSVSELLDTWQAALSDMAALSESLTDDQWLAGTPCPGWTVADVVAHTTDIESLMGGLPRPDHTPDWDSLPHAASPFGQFTETGVDYRRNRSRTEVIAELRECAAVRLAQVAGLPEDAEVMGVTGKQVPLARMVRTRTFDIWAHEQDIRAAVGQDGHWDSRPAIVAFQQMATALPYVWGKGVGAPSGATVHVRVTGPDLEANLYAAVGADGLATPASPTSDPTVSLTVSWPDYMRLSCGRVDVNDAAFRDRIALSGDEELADSLLEELTITP